MTVRVATIDSHEIVRDGIAAGLANSGVGVQVVASTATVEEYVARGVAADVVLFDPVPEADASTDLIAGLVARGERVLIFTVEERLTPLWRAIQLGVGGVLFKDERPENLVAAILEVAAGGLWCSVPLARALLSDESIAAALSPWQVEILFALIERPA